jgi:hypothetical protein
VLRASSGFWAVLVAFVRLAVPAEYDAQLSASLEEISTPNEFLRALIQRTWAHRLGLQQDLR